MNVDKTVFQKNVDKTGSPVSFKMKSIRYEAIRCQFFSPVVCAAFSASAIVLIQQNFCEAFLPLVTLCFRFITSSWVFRGTFWIQGWIRKQFLCTVTLSTERSI